MDPAQNQSSPPPTTIPPQPMAPPGMESTEISLEEAKKLEHTSKNKKKKILIMGISGAVILFIIFAIFLIMLGSSKKQVAVTPTPSPTKAPPKSIPTFITVDTSSHPQILLPYVGHFYDLKVSDIINISDIRGVFNYKNNLIIVSFSGIVEIDPKTNEFIRQNDPRLLKCINYATVIGNMLYVACNGWDTMPQATTRGVYAINLDTGKLEKTYKENEILFTNVFVGNNDTTLWIGGSNGVVKINTKTEDMEKYTPDMLNLTDCTDFRVYTYMTNTWVTCTTQAQSAIALYDVSKNTWQAYAPPTPTQDQIYTLGFNQHIVYFLTEPANQKLYTLDLKAKTMTESDAGKMRIPSSKPEAAEMRALLQNDVIFKGLGQPSIAFLPYFDTTEKKVKDFELIISPYIGTSDIVNEKRYLFTKSTIDTLEDRKFANFFVQLKGNLIAATKVYVDPSETYAIVVGPKEVIAGVNPPFSAQQIMLKTGEVTDLLGGEDQPLKEVPQAMAEKLAENIKNYTFVGTGKKAELTDPTTGNTVLEFNLPNKQMTFDRYSFGK